MTNFSGVIIEESLENKEILKKVKITSKKKIGLVAEKHKTPWLSRWTLLTIEVPENKAREIAEEISKSLDRNHSGSWYADFKNNTHHYIIFRDKIFCVDRKNQEQYDGVKHYGASLGIPKYQLDFHTEKSVS